MLEQNDDESLQAALRLAALEIVSGKNESQVEQALLEKGLDTETARLVTAAAFGTTSRAIGNLAISAEAKTNMLVGLSSCALGVVVTAVTYQMAANTPRGGIYYVAWGAVVFGAIQFGRGAMQALQAR